MKFLQIPPRQRICSLTRTAFSYVVHDPYCDIAHLCVGWSLGDCETTTQTGTSAQNRRTSSRVVLERSVVLCPETNELTTLSRTGNVRQFYDTKNWAFHGQLLKVYGRVVRVFGLMGVTSRRGTCYSSLTCATHLGYTSVRERPQSASYYPG